MAKYKTINVPPETHRIIDALAFARDCSMVQIIVEAIEEKADRENLAERLGRAAAPYETGHS